MSNKGKHRKTCPKCERVHFGPKPICAICKNKVDNGG